MRIRDIWAFMRSACSVEIVPAGNSCEAIHKIKYAAAVADTPRLTSCSDVKSWFCMFNLLDMGRRFRDNGFFHISLCL